MKDNLNEEILRQLSLIKFDRGKTISENNIQFISEQEWCKSKEAAGVKSVLFSQGFFKIPKSYWTWGCPGYKAPIDAYNDAALSAMRYLTNLLFNQIQYTTLDPFFKVNVISNKAAGEWKFNKFDQNLIDTLKQQLYSQDDMGRMDESRSRNIYNTFVLQDFYFNFPKVKNDLSLFEDSNPWGFINNFFGTSPGNVGSQINIPNAVNSIQSVNAYKQPKLNTGSKSGDVVRKVDDQFKASNETNFDPYVSLYHNFSPILSLILSIYGGIPGMVVGSALEQIDAALYEFYDEDPYMAGFALAMSFIPYGELTNFPGFKQMVKIYGSERKALNGFGKKLIGQSDVPFSQAEKEFLKSSSNAKIIGRQLKKATAKILNKAVKNKGSKFVLNLVADMARGLGWNNRIMRTFYMIWGVTYSYDWWAYHNLGECSATFNFDELTSLIGIRTSKLKNNLSSESVVENHILKLKNELILQLNPQPFTSSPEECKKIAEIKLYEEYQKLLRDSKNMFKATLLVTFENIFEKKQTISLKNGKNYQVEVEMLQLVLLQCVGLPKMGIDYKVENNYGTDNSLKNAPQTLKNLITKTKGKTDTYSGSKITLQNVSNVKKIEILGNLGVMTSYSKVLDTIYPKMKNTVTSKKIMSGTGFKIKTEYLDGTIKTSEVISVNPYTETVTGFLFSKGQSKEGLNWGYFDELTKIMVEVYQGQNNLPQTGVVNSQTISSVINTIKNDSCGQIKNVSNVTVDKETQQINLMKQSIFNLIDTWETSNDEPDELTPQQQKDSIDIINKYIDFENSYNANRAISIIDTVYRKN